MAGLSIFHIYDIFFSVQVSSSLKNRFQKSVDVTMSHESCLFHCRSPSGTFDSDFTSLQGVGQDSYLRVSKNAYSTGVSTALLRTNGPKGCALPALQCNSLWWPTVTGTQTHTFNFSEDRFCEKHFVRSLKEFHHCVGTQTHYKKFCWTCFNGLVPEVRFKSLTLEIW